MLLYVYNMLLYDIYTAFLRLGLTVGFGGLAFGGLGSWPWGLRVQGLRLIIGTYGFMV